MRLFVIIVCTVLPIILYLWMGEPVQLLMIAGVIEAAHIPVLVGCILVINYKTLPKELKPGIFTTIMTTLSGLFFAAFTIVYLLDLFSIINL